MKNSTSTTTIKGDLLQAKNGAVKTAYQNILKEIKEALPQYPTEYHRTFIEVDYNSLGLTCKHGFFSPLIHVQLEETDGQLQIVFSRNITIKQQVGNLLDGLLTRLVYKNTAEGNTPINIEDALFTDVYKVDDYRQANNLLLKGFKEGKKVTV